VANLSKVSTLTYFLFLFFAAIGIGFIISTFTYTISIEGNILELFIKIPFKIKLIKLHMEDIVKIEKVEFRLPTHYPCYGNYLFKKQDGIKLTIMSGKIITISGVDIEQISTLIILHNKTYKLRKVD
jgi:hypothetical protein